MKVWFKLIATSTLLRANSLFTYTRYHLYSTAWLHLHIFTYKITLTLDYIFLDKNCCYLTAKRAGPFPFKSWNIFRQPHFVEWLAAGAIGSCLQLYCAIHRKAATSWKDLNDRRGVLRCLLSRLFPVMHWMLCISSLFSSCNSRLFTCTLCRVEHNLG